MVIHVNWVCFLTHVSGQHALHEILSRLYSCWDWSPAAWTIAPTVSLGAWRENPMKALPKNPLEDGGKREARGIDRLSTDMILKPWYWELESPRIHISKTLIPAPLTAGLAFTLTSRQLLLQISRGNFILLTIHLSPLLLLPSRALFPPVCSY